MNTPPSLGVGRPALGAAGHRVSRCSVLSLRPVSPDVSEAQPWRGEALQTAGLPVSAAEPGAGLCALFGWMGVVLLMPWAPGRTPGDGHGRCVSVNIIPFFSASGCVTCFCQEANGIK